MSRRYCPLSRARRRGQALLLAVLIMIFAALLSASFILVVSVNLNQTARQTDKNRAVASATAGLDYINERLTYSDEGERWRPQIPASSEMGYSTYYTALDRAQGWADDFAKFPDPRNLSFSDDSPLFLAKVEPASRAGVLKITVIGLSPTDPTAFHTEIRYKGGYERNPIAQVMRVVGNYDFKNNVVPVAQVKNGFTYDTATKEVPLENVSGEFPSGAFAVTLGGPNTPTRTTRGFAVASYDKSDPNNPKLILASSPTAPADVPTAGERVELAANLGAPLGIDDDNNPATPNTPFPTSILPQVSDGNVTGGVKVNGGLWWTGNIIADQLRSINQASSTNSPAGSLQASGVVAKDAGASVTLSSAEVSTSVDMLNSSQVTFPVNNSAWAGTNTTKYDLVNDGWDRLRGVPTASTRNVSSFRPPALDSPENLERYRNLTRFSKPVAGSPSPTSPLYGIDGEGIYIDNTQDQEKIYDASLTPPRLREMTQSELVKMWLSPTGATGNFVRNSTTIAAPNVLDASLEEQHLRGWVGPDEFRARGVEIELGDNSLTITRDTRDDNTTTATTNALGPVASKAWKNENGVLQTGLYRKTLPWPINGVVFAEGNVRIRGTVTSSPNSLTVVSMGNIYIEDSMGIASTATNPPKILLLAKKNVVMNPTRVLGRPDVQTTVAPTPAAASNTVTLAVGDTGGFLNGDVIETTSSGTPSGNADCVGQVTAIDSAARTMNVKVFYSRTGNVEANSALRSRPDARLAVNGVNFTKIGTVQDAIQRRFTLPDPDPSTPVLEPIPNTTRLALRHQGVSKPVFDVKTVAAPAAAGDPPFSKPSAPEYIYFSHKRVMDMAATPTFVPGATSVSDPNKLIRGDFSTPPSPNTDKFPATLPTDNGAANGQTLTVIADAMKSNPPHTDSTSRIGWKYEVTPLPAYNSVPFFYLAGVGNRFDFSPPTTNPERREDILKDAGYNVPLATSIGLWLNGAVPGISDDISTAFKTSGFGFNPKFKVTTVASEREEDILTSEASFYQPETEIKKVTLDSRTLNGWNAGPNALTFRQSEGLTNIDDTTNPLPDYRLFSMKLENVDLTNSVINQGYEFNVNAFVYAQTGSWFIIPGADYESRVRGDGTKSYYDFNDNQSPDAGEWIDGAAGTAGTWDDGDAADLNRNGIVDAGEAIAALRFDSRYNYQINFTGAIAENQTPLVNNAGSAVGAVADWMNKWATTTVAGGTVTRDRMKYTFDPAVALGQLQNDTGFRLPHTLDLTSQG